MKIRMWVDRNLALQAGLDAHGWQTVEVPAGNLSAAERAELSNYSGSRDADYQLPKGGYTVAVASAATVCEALAVLAADRAAAAAALKQRVDDAVAKTLAMEPAAVVVRNGGCLETKRHRAVFGVVRTARWQVDVNRLPCRYGDRDAVVADPRLTEWLAEAQEIVAAGNAEAKSEHAAAVAKADEAEARHRREREAAEKAQAAASAAHRAALEAFIREHGTANQQARLAEGLLANREMQAAYNDHAFAAVADWPQASHLADDEICSCERYDDVCCEIEVDGGEAEEVTAAEYEALTRLRARLPEATIKPQVDVLSGSDCGSVARQHYMRAWLGDDTLGAIRDFAYPTEAAEGE